MEDECSGLGNPTDTALGYRIGGLFGILASSLVGYVFPIIFAGRFRYTFFLLQTFSAGVVTAVAIIHIFPEAIETLANPCLGFSDFPWAATLTLFALLGTYIFEHSLHLFLRYFKKTMDQTNAVTDEGRNAFLTWVLSGVKNNIPHGSEVHLLFEIAEKQTSEEDIKLISLRSRTVLAYTLEIGIVFHSVFIGLSLGTSTDESFVKGLAFALMFHQGFEGVALGGAVVKAEFGLIKMILFGVMFALTAPLGVAIGLAVGSSYNENSKTLLGSSGVVNAIAAGILIHNGLVDLLLPAFNDEDGFGKTLGGSLFGFLCLLGGGGAMTLIAKWA